jgi:hypothetical protein
MNTIRVEPVRFLSITRYETDEPIPPELFDKPPLVFLETVGWTRLVPNRYFTDQMTGWCANDCVTITPDGQQGYTVTVEVSE